MQEHVMPGRLATTLTSMTDVAITRYRLRSDLMQVSNDIMQKMQNQQAPYSGHYTAWPSMTSQQALRMASCN